MSCLSITYLPKIILYNQLSINFSIIYVTFCNFLYLKGKLNRLINLTKMKNYKIVFISLSLIFLTTVVFAQTEKYPFEVQKTGEGSQSIIFIPGFASSGEVWDETVIQFKDHYTCYILTMPGFAGAKPEKDPSFKKWESHIVDFIKEKHLKKPIIVGHSMGGGLALALASDYPNLPKKLIIVDALPFLDAISNPTLKAKKNIDCTSSIEKIKKLDDNYFRQMQKMAISQLVTDTLMQKKVLGWSMNSDRATFGKMFCDFSNTDLREKIKNITCPTLVMLESNFNNFKSAIEDQYKKLKNVDLVYADKGLHFIMYDDKDWYFNQLNNFITPN